MTDAPAPTGPAAPPQGLAARALGVIFAPYETYADVSARPRALGALALVIVISAVTAAVFSSSQIGRELTLDQAISGMEAWGMQVTDEMYRNIETGIMNQPVWQTGVYQAVFWPIFGALNAGILLFVFNVILGHEASFKQVFAVVVHSFILVALQMLVVYPVMYLKESMASPTSLTVFLPFLDNESFAARFLRWVDFFWLWWIVNLSIGLAVLYKRRTQPVVISFLAVYFFFALVFAAIGAFFFG